MISMLAMYLATLGFGGTLIVVSLLLGGAMDKSLDKDLSADHADHGGAETVHDAHLAWWIPLLSLRFWTFGLAAFGAAGTLSSLLSLPASFVFALALAIGVGVGWASARFFAALHRDQVTADVRLEGLSGEEAKVILPIRADHDGKIAVSTLGGRVELLARTRDRDPIPAGAVVLVASVGSDGVADVSRLPTVTDGARGHHPVRVASSVSGERSG